MRRLLPVFLFLFYLSCFAQNTDSLSAALKAMRADSNKINELFKIANELSPEDSARASQYANEMLSISQKLNYKKGVAKAYQTIGQIAYNSHSFERAVAFLEKAVAAFEECKYVMGQLDCHFWLACCYRRTANYPLYRKYLALMEREAKQINHKAYLARTYEGFGNLYRYLGQYSLSIENYVRSIDISEKNGQLDQAVVALNNLSLVYGMMGQSEEELKIESRAYNIALKIKDSSNLVLYLGNLSSLYRGMNQMDTAQKCIDIAMDIIKRRGESNINFKDAASTYEQVSALAAANKNYKKAVEFQNKAINISKTYGDIKNVAYGYSSLADIFVQMQNKTFAEEYYLKSLEINKNIGFLNGELNNYGSLESLYKSLNKPDKAKECAKQYAILKDSADAMTNARKLEESSALLQIQAQQEELFLQEKAKEKKESEVKKDRVGYLGFIYFFGLVGLVLGGLFFTFRYGR